MFRGGGIEIWLNCVPYLCECVNCFSIPLQWTLAVSMVVGRINCAINIHLLKTFFCILSLLFIVFGEVSRCFLEYVSKWESKHHLYLEYIQYFIIRGGQGGNVIPKILLFLSFPSAFNGYLPWISRNRGKEPISVNSQKKEACNNFPFSVLKIHKGIKFREAGEYHWNEAGPVQFHSITPASILSSFCSNCNNSNSIQYTPRPAQSGSKWHIIIYYFQEDSSSISKRTPDLSTVHLILAMGQTIQRQNVA